MAFDQSTFNAQIAAHIRTALDLQARVNHGRQTISDADADTLTTAFATVNAAMAAAAVA